LIGLYRQTLGVLAEMPADAAYRKSTESLVNSRLSVAEEARQMCYDVSISYISQAKNADEIETVLSQGQVEQIIAQVRLTSK
jgi:hypothetical protein